MAEQESRFADTLFLLSSKEQACLFKTIRRRETGLCMTYVGQRINARVFFSVLHSLYRRSCSLSKFSGITAVIEFLDFFTSHDILHLFTFRAVVRG